MVLRASLRHKKLIIFDLDGTLTESKSTLDREMSSLLGALLKKKKVAVIGGGTYTQFKDQFLKKLRISHRLLPSLFLFPTNATSFYTYAHGWKRVYNQKLSGTAKKKILRAFQEVFRKTGYAHPSKAYGRVIEDRGTQLTFSALGQDVVSVLGKRGIRLKEIWNKKYNHLRFRMMKELEKLLPEFEVRVGGLTSIDVTRKGIDKAYGVRQIRKHLAVPTKDMLFIGDALYPGGNDYAARKTGIDCLAVQGPKETKKIIRFLV